MRQNSKNKPKEEGGYGNEGDDLHFITDKGGPGATCVRNSTEHQNAAIPRAIQSVRGPSLLALPIERTLRISHDLCVLDRVWLKGACERVGLLGCWARVQVATGG